MKTKFSSMTVQTVCNNKNKPIMLFIICFLLLYRKRMKITQIYLFIATFSPKYTKFKNSSFHKWRKSPKHHFHTANRRILFSSSVNKQQAKDSRRTFPFANRAHTHTYAYIHCYHIYAYIYYYYYYIHIVL